MENSKVPESVVSQMHNQWSNPDVLALLLLVGGDIIQKALAQFVGVPVKIPGSKLRLYLTPVAFSFGWVSYAFMALMSCIGNNRLMPEPDCPVKVINCQNGYSRINRSWVLGRILRDHVAKHVVNKAEISIRIDVFELTDEAGPSHDIPWIIGWVVIALQNIVAIIVFACYGDFMVFVVTLAGTFGALVTGSLAQWEDEKWPIGRQLTPNKKKTICLTQGNGHHHVMVIIADKKGWDLEAMAGSPGNSRKATIFACITLALWWTLLLIAVAGLVKLRWFLFLIGGIGMLQNIYAAGAIRSPGSFNVFMKPYEACPTIIGIRGKPEDKHKDTPDSDEDPEPKQIDTKEKIGVMGALMAVENLLPDKGVGASLVTEFFPGGLAYQAERFSFKRERKFWKMAFRRIQKQQSKQVPSSTKTSSPTSHETQSSVVQPANVQALTATSQVEGSASSSATEIAKVESTHLRKPHDASHPPDTNLASSHPPNANVKKQ